MPDSARQKPYSEISARLKLLAHPERLQILDTVPWLDTILGPVPAERSRPLAGCSCPKCTAQELPIEWVMAASF
ncbi:MAG: hypothetical protein NTV69_17360 [Caldilinea sp.]|nr:hypothetical protein [Caldilinea sp.]